MSFCVNCGFDIKVESAKFCPVCGKEISRPLSSDQIDSFIMHNISKTSSMNLSSFTSAEQLRMLTKTLHDKTKAQWSKNDVVQYKDEGLVILQRMWGSQVQFIVACSQVTKEGYRLMAIDEGKEGGQSSGGFTGGVNAYFYFQKMDYVR